MRRPLVISLFCVVFALKAQTPFIENYTPEDYVASTQNWAIQESQDGLMYFGNNEGVLEYDGINWRLIKLKTTVRSLAMDESGTIYVGAVNNFGKLVRDNKGVLKFESLTHLIPEGKGAYKDVWRIRMHDNAIFFCSFDKIFRLKDGQIRVYETQQKRFTFAFIVHDNLYVHEEGGGILKYNGDDFELLPDTENYGKAPRVYLMLPYGEDQMLIGTRVDGLSLYSLSEQKRQKDIPSSLQAASDFFIEKGGYSGLALPNGNYMIGTTSVGMILTSSTGEILEFFDKTKGLQDNSVYKLEITKSGLLWCALSSGISSVNLQTPFKKYTLRDGLDGTIFTLTKHENEVYIGTSRNAFKLNADNEIEPIAGTVTQNWFLKTKQDKVLLAHNPLGFLEIKDNQAIPIKNNRRMVGVGFEDIQDKPDYLLGGAHQGFFLLRFENDEWKIQHKIEGFDESIYSFLSDENGYYWVRCSPNDLYRVRFNDSLDKVVEVKKYNTKEHQLETGTIMAYRLNNGQIVFGSDDGVYQFNEATNQFERFPLMAEMQGDVGPIFQDSKGRIWYEHSQNGQHTKGYFYKKGEAWINVQTPFFKFSKAEIYKGASSIILEDTEGNIVFGTTKGLVVYDPELAVDYETIFPAFIRKVFVNDTLLTVPKERKAKRPYILSYTENSVKFEYATAFYEESYKNKYAYRLVGRSDIWSDWSSISSKEYTNLPEGAYTFEVKSKNLYEKTGQIASFSFNVNPPWYRSTWAYLVYLILLIYLVYGVALLNSARLRRQNDELERKVRKRTAQLKSEKEKTELLLQELDELNQTKDRIFAIMGHDLRKPAIAFRGIAKKVNYLLRKKDYATIEKIGANIEKNAYALNILVDNLLNWALTQKDTVPHKPELLDLDEIIENNVLIFEQIAADKNIELSHSATSEVYAWADRNALLTIVRNLVDNALKYTPQGGKVTLSAVELNQRAKIIIRDTGWGISPEKMEDLFKLQKNKSEKGTEGEKGIGLGLHLVYELVKINEGEILVESKLGEGTVFTVDLPIET